MDLKKFFKIMLSVGFGLVSGSLLIYLISDINPNRSIAKRGNKNFSSTSNVNKKIMNNAFVSKRVINSKNNRYLKLANYPVVKSDIAYYPSVKNTKHLGKIGKNLEINVKINEMYDRGYTTNKYHRSHKENASIKYDKNIAYRVIDNNFIISSEKLIVLKSNTFINGNLYIKNIDFLKLPKNLYINGNVYVINSKGLLISENTIINGHVIVSGVSSLRHMVNSIKISGQVFIKS